jgi:hypothetical protein
MIGVVMPSRRAHFSTSLPPTSLNSCTDGTFFDQISAYSIVTWYSTVLLRLVGGPHLAGHRITSARGTSFSSDVKP